MHLAFLHQFIQMAIGQAFIIYCMERCTMSQSSDCLLTQREIILNICWLKLWLVACSVLSGDSWQLYRGDLWHWCWWLRKCPSTDILWMLQGVQWHQHSQTQPSEHEASGEDISMRCFLAFPIDVWWLLWPIPPTVSNLLWREAYLCPRDGYPKKRDGFVI